MKDLKKISLIVCNHKYLNNNEARQLILDIIEDSFKAGRISDQSLPVKDEILKYLQSKNLVE